MSNYKIVSTKNEPRVELKEALNLSDCELSINEFGANVSVPFVHSHKQNEEVYLVLEGGGVLFIDGEEVEVKKGDAIRIDPAGKRCFKTGSNGMKYICIQAKKDSLEQFTMSDGVINEDVKPSWL
ncbi:cupin domain-containing protein [Campylobacter sp. RM12920]|uniref:Cupin domain-containing protein n=1 Tax=Campylobacter californiensis TaxID=1032243 RepID=A0ABD4JKI3_9BACT|nr:cupin domain-containing protein [Campylobacter sp. RM12919]MBE2988915.1 cupin domain-containing protein [Campylobacter sp. RM12920]